jgi:hypothetical protein
MIQQYITCNTLTNTVNSCFSRVYAVYYTRTSQHKHNTHTKQRQSFHNSITKQSSHNSIAFLSFTVKTCSFSTFHFCPWLLLLLRRILLILFLMLMKISGLHAGKNPASNNTFSRFTSLLVDHSLACGFFNTARDSITLLQRHLLFSQHSVSF